ncbi:beta-galactosidase [Streptomyces sp. NRRL S-481]|uniref:beta-galactosidase n=1 Tax=Streptomyces sp. NRRL S-481 TaxID=1463911 RepID=UPI001F2C3226|nr:beta-galactosidase [Streptomyces sp. NRRL S-481]
MPLWSPSAGCRCWSPRRTGATGRCAKLIAPYLQSSGWNFGYTPSSGNWGRPGNFMSHGYDFGGYVTSTGVARPEYAEAQVLARVVEVWGARLALAVPGAADSEVSCDFPTSWEPAALDLPGGGRLVAVPHLGADPGTADVRGVRVAVAPGSCPLMAVDVPLRPWGSAATLTLASADLVAAADGVLVFSSDVPVTVVLDGTRTEIPVSGSGTVAGVTLVVLSSADAARLRSLDSDGAVHLADAPQQPDKAERTAVRAVRRRSDAAPEERAGLHVLPPALESLGVYRGRGAYRTTTDLTDVDALLLTGAADIVDLTVAGRTHPPIAAFGAARRIDVRNVTGRVAIEAVVEIWGHANFDDARLPALRLGALRGLGSLWKVLDTTDVSALWTVHGHWAGDPAPTRVLGGWSSTRVAAPLTYTRTVHARTPSALYLRGIVEPLRVCVDDGEPETVHTENPWVLLTAGTHQVSVTLPHHPSGPGLRAELLALDAVRDWSCAVQDDELLTAFAAAGSGHTEEVRLPLVLKPGEEAWLDVDLPASPDGYLVRLDATQVRVTGWAGGECLGRVWSGERPDFSGGDPDAFWVPPSWSGLTLLAQGIEGPGTPEVRTLWLGGPAD